MLTAEAGQSLTGGPAKLPLQAPARITFLDNVQQVAHTALIKNKNIYRNPMIRSATPLASRSGPPA